MYAELSWGKEKDTDCTKKYTASFKSTYNKVDVPVTLTREATSGHTWGSTWSMANGSATVHERECTHAVCVQKDTCEAAWKSCVSNHNGTHTYTCTEGHTVTVNCSGGAATCMDPAVCQYCDESYGRADPSKHGWGEYISNGDCTHTRICKYNSSHTETGDCSGGTATCTEAKTCSVCHTKYGSALGHDWDYTANGNGTHTLKCKRDPAHTEIKDCSGGTATCTEQATCDYCQTQYGSVDSNNHDWINCYINTGDGQHNQICGNDSSHTRPGSCSGGTATCISPAVCEHCNTAYGEPDPDHHEKSVTVPGVAPTYTKTCLTEGAVCGDCGTVLIEQEIIPMLPPQTGDSSRLVLWLTLMAASLTGLALLMHRRRKA